MPARPARRYPRGIYGPWPRAILRATIVCGLGFMWTWLFWFQPARSFPVIEHAIFAVDHVFNLVPIRGSFAWAFKSYVLVLVPIAVILAIVRRPTALGLGGVARYGWRIIVLGFAIALPFCIWLGLRPGMHTYYALMFKDGGWKLLLANALVIVVEHAWIEGVILALALPGGGFASSSADSDLARLGALAFLGVGFPRTSPTTSAGCGNGCGCRHRDACLSAALPSGVPREGWGLPGFRRLAGCTRIVFAAVPWPGPCAF